MNKGFTLVELLVAMAIIISSSLAFGYVFQNAKQKADQLKKMTACRRAAQDKMEKSDFSEQIPLSADLCFYRAALSWDNCRPPIVFETAGRKI